ncbi:MAG: hypothetical protein HYX36_03545 [Rhizobiales bacterium]|nr:hypothetical protein [Hyphomicrobiales bacterium]
MIRPSALTVAILTAASLFSMPAGAGNIKHIIVIVMENTDAVGDKKQNYIYGNTKEAPYINQRLIPQAARAADFTDLIPDLVSEPHYILMEAGTNSFPDVTFTCDSDPLSFCDETRAKNWTTSREHLTAQIDAAPAAAQLSWMSYQEGLDPEVSGICPLATSTRTRYTARHNPFMFFADIVGDPPRGDNRNCATHMKPLTDLEGDLAANRLANYVFITPNLCNDMHDKCGKSPIAAGDAFLKKELPPLIKWANANAAVIFVIWDEGSKTDKLPFFAVGAGVKKNYLSQIYYTHKSLIRTVETVFGLPVIEAVKDAEDFSDMFEPGAYP